MNDELAVYLLDNPDVEVCVGLTELDNNALVIVVILYF